MKNSSASGERRNGREDMLVEAYRSDRKGNIGCRLQASMTLQGSGMLDFANRVTTTYTTNPSRPGRRTCAPQRGDRRRVSLRMTGATSRCNKYLVRAIDSGDKP